MTKNSKSDEQKTFESWIDYNLKAFVENKLDFYRYMLDHMRRGCNCPDHKLEEPQLKYDKKFHNYAIKHYIQDIEIAQQLTEMDKIQYPYLTKKQEEWLEKELKEENDKNPHQVVNALLDNFRERRDIRPNVRSLSSKEKNRFK